MSPAASAIVTSSADASSVLASLAAADQIRTAISCAGTRALDDNALLQTAGVLKRVGRLVDALRVAAAADVADRSRPEVSTGKLSVKKGCRSATELVKRVTGVSVTIANRRIRIGGALRTQYSITGMDFPPTFPVVAAAVGAGKFGLDGAEAILTGLTPTLRLADSTRRSGAEIELVAAATGRSANSPVAATADEIRQQPLVWQAWIDPDGVRPFEDRAMLARGLRFGRERDGPIPINGGLMPEIAAKVMRLSDAYVAPKSAPVAFVAADGAQEGAQVGTPGDTRTTQQKRHDVFASLIDAAAHSAGAPSVGGAAPTVLVSVRQSDLDAGRGAGYIDGIDTPISLDSVKQMICTGGTQKIGINPEGRILELGSPERCFTAQQRRAIALRDGGCIIPVGWTEIHHVIPDAQGGPTHTDNGTSCKYDLLPPLERNRTSTSV